MNSTAKSAILTSVIGIAIVLCTSASMGSNDKLGRVIALAMVMALMALAILVTATILRRSPQTREYSNGVWIGGGIALLIGFGVCTSA